MTEDPIAATNGGLIVSVQTSEQYPLHSTAPNTSGARARRSSAGPRRSGSSRRGTSRSRVATTCRHAQLPGSDVLVTPTF
jgi:hypothetical protein